MAKKKVTTVVKSLGKNYVGSTKTTNTLDLQINNISAAFTNTQMTVKKKKYTVKNYDAIQATKGTVTIDTASMSKAISITTGKKNDTIVIGSGKTTAKGQDGNDTVKISTLAARSTLDGGKGTDTLVFKKNVTASLNGKTLTVGKNSSTIQNFEAFKAESGITFTATGSTGINFTASGSSSVKLTLGSGKSTVKLASGKDTITASSFVNGTSIDGGGGSDTVIFTAKALTGTLTDTSFTKGSSTMTIKNVETYTFGSGNDNITIAGNLKQHTLNGGSGTDTLTVSSNATIKHYGNKITVGDVTANSFEKLVTSKNNDTITIFNNATITDNGGNNTFSIYTNENDQEITVALNGTGTNNFKLYVNLDNYTYQSTDNVNLNKFMEQISIIVNDDDTIDFNLMDLESTDDESGTYDRHLILSSTKGLENVSREITIFNNVDADKQNFQLKANLGDVISFINADHDSNTDLYTIIENVSGQIAVRDFSNDLGTYDLYSVSMPESAANEIDLTVNTDNTWGNDNDNPDLVCVFGSTEMWDNAESTEECLASLDFSLKNNTLTISGLNNRDDHLHITLDDDTSEDILQFYRGSIYKEPGDKYELLASISIENLKDVIKDNPSKLTFTLVDEDTNRYQAS